MNNETKDFSIVMQLAQRDVPGALIVARRLGVFADVLDALTSEQRQSINRNIL